MDSHIHHHLDDQDALVSSARLPGEPMAPPAAGPMPQEPGLPGPEERLPPPEIVRPRRRARGVLLGGAAILLAGGGVVAFLVSPYNHILPVPGLTAEVQQIAASAGLVKPKLVAPSATLARVSLPPAAPAPVRDAFNPKPREDQVRELLALHAGTTRGTPVAPAPASVSVRAAPSLEPSNASDLVIGEPGAPVVQGSGGPAAAVTQPKSGASLSTGSSLEAVPPAALPPSAPAADPPVVASAAPTMPLPAATPAPTQAGVMSLPALDLPSVVPMADAVSVAKTMRAAPMTPQDQVQVLDLVTQMAKMVHDLRAQETQLRTDLRRATAEHTARLDDYGRRLALAEARSSVARAAQDDAVPGADLPAAATPAASPLASMPITARSAPVVVTAPPSQPVGPVAGLKRYRVQAASPGLALLAEVERGGGEGAQTQVMVGDSLPDYGKIKSIAQRGTAWVVTAERGTIQ